MDYKFPVNYQDIETFKGMCETPSCYGCADEMKEHFLLILREGGRSEPHDADEAKEIFMWMLHQI